MHHLDDDDDDDDDVLDVDEDDEEGDAEEGTRVLLEDRKFLKDVTFGKTKIFVRSPSTLFELEKAR